MAKKKSPAKGKVKSPSVSKTDGKESTPAQVADVVVEQPPVTEAGGKPVIETTGDVASSEIVSRSEKQKGLDKALDEIRSKPSSPTNGGGDTEMRVQEVVTLTNSMSVQESQEDSSEKKASDDRNTTAQVDEVASEQGVTTAVQEEDGDTQEMEAPSSSSGNADIIAMPMNSE